MAYRGYGGPWEQGGPFFGMNPMGEYDRYRHVGGPGGSMRFNEMDRSRYGMQRMMNNGFGGRMGPSMGFMAPGPADFHMNERERMDGFRDQMSRKRFAPGSPGGGPRTKRQNFSGNDRRKNRKKNRGDDTDASPHSKDQESGKNTENAEKNERKNAKGQKMQRGRGSQSNARYCSFCEFVCHTVETLRSHMKSQNHKMNVERMFMMDPVRAKALAGRTEAIENQQMYEMRDRVRYQGNQGGRKSGFYCTVCECEFGGSFLTHRRTKEHKKARDKKFPRCGLCFKTFNDPVDYKKHEKTEEHKKRLVQYAIKKELFGSDDDVFISIDASRFFEEEKEKENEKQQELEKDKSKENTEEKEEQKASEAKDENAEVEKGEENPENEEEKTEEKEVEPVGQTYVVEINGYFCKVCHKFYKDENIAKVSHCKSKMHHERHEKLLIAIEKKEARKKAAEEANRREEEEAKRREEEAKQREEEEAKRREEEEAKQREEEEAKEEEEEAKRKGRKKKLSRGRQKKLLLEKKKKKRMVKKKKLKKLTKKNKLLKILI
ncbi:uncharacterized protein LOC143230749 isoform X1 [Tachypleus tridentatus]|uniref:uncharacterized protein LOC143230749 isoform X1 n=1 Tax=Tachypleus tridentatus TaxID=6853 RepID=UPI003FCF5FB2